MGGARTDFRSASFLNSFKCCHTNHTLTLNIFWGRFPFQILISRQTFTRLWTFYVLMYSKLCWIDCLYSCLNLDEDFWQKAIHPLCVCIRIRSCPCMYLYLNMRWNSLNVDEGFGAKGAATATIIQVPDCCRLCCHCCSDSTEYHHWHHHHHHHHHHHYHCPHLPHRYIQLHWNHIYHHHQPSS